MKIQESAENYLEAILLLGNRGGQVRSVDIANHLGFSKPSVSVAMKNLRENGYIAVDGKGCITLTAKGLPVAESMYERHLLLTRWLVHMGVAHQTASEDACRMEHVLSAESFAAIKRYISEQMESGG